MTFTKDQIKMLLYFERGGHVTGFTQEQWEVFRFLDEQKLLQPRYDIEADLVYLTQHGQSVLAEYRRQLSAKKDRIDELAKADADKKSDRAIEHRFQLVNSLLAAATGSILTLLIEHFFKIISFIEGLFH